LDLEYPELQIDILGVNKSDASGHSQMPSAGSIPWLQDTDTDVNSLGDLETEMGANLRDVVIVDSQLEIVGYYNLTTNSLANQANFDSLKGMLVEAATPAPEPSSLILLALTGVLTTLRRRR